MSAKKLAIVIFGLGFAVLAGALALPSRAADNKSKRAWVRMFSGGREVGKWLAVGDVTGSDQRAQFQVEEGASYKTVIVRGDYVIETIP